MTEQERKKAFENQRRNAERRAKEADGTYDMERRIQYEKKQREERRLQQQRQALKQRKLYLRGLRQRPSSGGCGHQREACRTGIKFSGFDRKRY